MTSIAVVLALLLYCLPQTAAAFASATISLLPQGDSAYVIQATLPEETAAIELVLSYDRTMLSNPRSVQGSLFQNALVALNPNVSGTIRMAAVTTSPARGNGVIMTISFDGSLAGARSPTITAKLANLQGASLPVQIAISAPIPPATPAVGSQTNVAQAGSADPSSTAPPTSRSISPGTTSVSMTIPVGPSTAGTPATRDQAIPEQRVDRESAKDEGKAGAPPVVASREPAGPVSQASPSVVAKITFTQQSALELIKVYHGERTPAELIALLQGYGMIGFRQEPPVALSDGKTSIKVHFIAPSDLKGKPEVQLIDASLVNLDRDPDQSNTWIAEIRPIKGVIAAAIAVPLKNINAIFPLTVAPHAELVPKQPASESDFKQFLKSRVSGTLPRGDLNKDGKRDHLDDYIFTVNYLVERSKGN